MRVAEMAMRYAIMNETLTIALAHDDLCVLTFFQSLLAEMGYVVCVTARSGRDLIDAAAGSHPALIMVRQELPDMPGLAAAEVVAGERAIPVIVLLNVQNVPAAGMIESPLVAAIITEPVKRADLISTVPLAIERSRQQQQLRAEIQQISASLENAPPPTATELREGD